MAPLVANCSYFDMTTARPPSMEIPEADNQAVKRRMPPEIKQKLAKVARLGVIDTIIAF